MKRLILLSLAVSWPFALSAMEAKKNKLLTFKTAQKGDYLGKYKEILLEVYPTFATDKSMAGPIKVSLFARFEVLTGWIGQKGKLFVTIQDEGKPVGFMSLEALNEENTRIAIHHSPILPEYQAEFRQHFDYVKKVFPHAKEIFTSASNRAAGLQALVEKMGFNKDPYYVPNKELVPDATGFTGYRRSLE